MLRILFSINFKEFITPKLISWIYLLSLLGIGVLFILGLAYFPVPWLLILAIPLYLFVIALLRVSCEFVIVVFNIEANTRKDD